VGHSTKSNTYFLNFGPSRASFTGVIFASALERFAQKKIDPTNYEGKNVEITGQIKNHPRFGLEMILEDPSQIKLLD
jgi:DNA/RNA endonuclease YhcR with UshA esterase domain